MKPFVLAPALVALVSGALLSATMPTYAPVQALASGQLAPAYGYCCLPSQVARVEARLPIHPVNPQVTVHYVTHLKLVNIRILPNPGEASINRPSGVNTIQYDFGYIAPTTGNLFVRPRPRYVRVIETVEQRRASGISITNVLGGVQTTPIPAGYYSPLILVVAQPQRHLTFFIESNIPRNRLRLLGQLLVTGGLAPRSLTALLVLPRNFDGSMGALIAGARAGAPIKRASEDNYKL